MKIVKFYPKNPNEKISIMGLRYARSQKDRRTHDELLVKFYKKFFASSFILLNVTENSWIVRSIDGNCQYSINQEKLIMREVRC